MDKFIKADEALQKLIERFQEEEMNIDPPKKVKRLRRQPRVLMEYHPDTGYTEYENYVNDSLYTY